MTKCSECGKRIKGRLTKKNSVFFNGKYYCKECFERNFFECDDCGEIHRRAEIHFTYNSRYICDGCAENGYIRCNDCGYLVPEEDAYRTYNGERICPDCADEY